MNINRHNYEEFFILYLDNELNEAERRRVEAFAALHPDLQEELDLLLQTKLQPEAETFFASKEELLKNETIVQQEMPAYTEQLLLYTDNELTAAERKETEKLLAANNEAAALLAQLQRSRTQPDESVVFPDKELLYRHTVPARAAVVRMRWWRAAAAAVLIAGVSATLFTLLNRPAGTENEVTPLAEQKQEVNAAQQVADASPAADTKEQANDNSSVASAAQQDASPLAVQAADAVQKRRQERINSTAVYAAVQKQESTAEIKNGNGNNLPSPANNPNAKDMLYPEKNITAALSNDRKEALTDFNEINTTAAVTADRPGPLHIINAASIETAGSEDVAMESGKKNKMRGFFRKLTRTFEKATNIKATDDEDRLLIAGLAIKL